MVKKQFPTITQANIMFFITAVLTLAGSILLQPKLGTGTNLWINEFVYILLPPLLLARINRWPVETVYRFNKISVKSKLISIFSALAIWPFTFYLSKNIKMLLDNKAGVIQTPQPSIPSIYQSLLLIIGMIVLAPICEEIFFRGFVQRAYEGRSKSYGFVTAALTFGAYHVLNGISEVIPACILGLCMGFLVYKTGSLASSMLFHAVANISALIIGGAFEMHIREGIPVWLHIIAFAGLCISLLLLRNVGETDNSSGSAEEENHDNTFSATGKIFLILSIIFLVSTGIAEIMARSGIVQ